MLQFSCRFAFYRVIISQTACVHVSSVDWQCDA